MNEATQITMPYTIAVFMVRDFLGPDASQAQISRLTGILVRHAVLITANTISYTTLTRGGICRLPAFVRHNL